MRIVVEKSTHLLTLLEDEVVVLRCQIALGRNGQARKQLQGDCATPEGVYRICLVKEQGKYGRSLGLSYPNQQDAALALKQGHITQETYQAIADAQQHNRRPPWGTALGGEIYLHEGDTATDWTQGCIAVSPQNMQLLFSYWQKIHSVEIRR
ncbi:MAG: L,D-transpeptidase [Clostridia bacterium]